MSKYLSAAGDNVSNGGIIMSVSMALSIEKMVNTRDFARQAKRKFHYGGDLHVKKK